MFELPPLPYEKNALSPYMSENTLSFHHDKHHATYVNKLNEFIEGTEYENASLEKIITETHGKKDKVGIFNNAAQVWNHTFFWHSMHPEGGGKPKGPLYQKIAETWNSYENFQKEFIKAGATQFGSGWVWLVLKDGNLEIMKTPNADLPMVYGAKALLTCDVWEHAYYLDYQNRRPEFLTTFLDNLANWEFAEHNYSENI